MYVYIILLDMVNYVFYKITTVTLPISLDKFLFHLLRWVSLVIEESSDKTISLEL